MLECRLQSIPLCTRIHESFILQFFQAAKNLKAVSNIRFILHITISAIHKYIITYTNIGWYIDKYIGVKLIFLC